jgi:MFS family permease
MAGMLVTSIVSGQLISRTGRYKVFPIVGTGVMTLGLFLLAGMTAETSLTAASGMMLLLGIGMGLVMQVLVIAVQNAVDYADLGVATSGAVLFRLIGGAVGTSVLGAILAARLRAAPGAGSGMSLDVVAALGPEARAAYSAAFTAALGTAFLVAAAVALVGFALTWLLPERPLRESIAAATATDVGGDVGQAFAMPTDGESLPHLMRGLAVLADRDARRRYIEGIVARAGVDLSPLAAWLLIRIEGEPSLDLAAVAQARGIDHARLVAAEAELGDKGLVVGREPTTAGCEVYDRLVAARRERLGELFAEWTPEKRAEVADVLRQLASELVPDGRHTLREGRSHG